MFGMVETVAPASFTIERSLAEEGDIEGDMEEAVRSIEVLEEVERADTRGRRGSVFV